MTHPMLSALGLADTNSGTFLGNDEWSKTTNAGATSRYGVAARSDFIT